MAVTKVLLQKRRFALFRVRDRKWLVELDRNLLILRAGRLVANVWV